MCEYPNGPPIANIKNKAPIKYVRITGTSNTTDIDFNSLAIVQILVVT